MDPGLATGRALRDGAVLANELVLIEQAELESIALPVAGGGTVYRHKLRHDPTLIRFLSIADRGFRSELDRLAAARREVNIGRRDRGWAPAPVDIELDNGILLRGVQVQRPLNGFGAPEAISFNVYIPEQSIESADAPQSERPRRSGG